MEVSEIMLLVLAMKRLQTLCGNSEWIRDGEADAPRSNVKPQDASWRG